MTSFHGGKQRIGKKIANVIYENTKDIDNIVGYCEPFCGMLGVYRHIPELIGNSVNYIGGDKNKSVILMWGKAQHGWIPPTSCTEDEFNRLKLENSCAEKGFIGHQFSYGSQYFVGFSGKYGGETEQPVASNRVVIIAKTLKNIKLTSGSYTQFSHLENHIIYCDPPYDSTTNRYSGDDNINWKFDHKTFRKWCTTMFSKGNVVFVSEYKNISNAKLVFESKHKLTGKNPKSRKRIEKLFMLI